MPVCGPQFERILRGLGIILLTLGLGRTPLPAIEYHSVRHHDGPGEVCQHHAHLLRWHRDIDPGQDVAILHWHWFLPGVAADPFATEEGPRLRLHAPDWFEVVWEDGPAFAWIAPPPSLVDRGLDSEPSPDLIRDLDPAPPLVRSGPARPARAFTSTFAARRPLLALLHHWVC